MISPIQERKRCEVFGLLIDCLGWDQCIETILLWACRKESRYVCFCNSHAIMEASRRITLRKILNNADLACSDGTPVALSMRFKGIKKQERINGPDMMERLCREAAIAKISVFLYGGSPSAVVELKKRLQNRFRNLSIAGAISPPFRDLSFAEDSHMIDRINESGAGIVFVGLGFPKQEIWMATHKNRIQGVMLGVGAAFDFHSGNKKRAPIWLQHYGLEWLHRLYQEPMRLGKRYLIGNSFVIWLAARELMRFFRKN